MATRRLREGFGRAALASAAMCLCAGSLFAAASSDQAKLVSADIGFAFGLLKELAQEQPAKNVFISPYSISTVLQMVCNGAAGSTRDEMSNVLGTAGLQTSALNKSCKDLDASIRSAGSDVTLTIANSIWYSVGINVRPQFISINRDYFGAAIQTADFTDPRTAGIINRWADENTQGRIKQISQGRLPGDTRMILANAIYFKGSWERKFDAKLTLQKNFNLSESRVQLVPMMQQGGEYQYREGNGFQAVRLPYKGGRLGMYVLLPEGYSATKLLATLNDQMWQQQVLAQLSQKKGNLSLPRFKLEYGAELKQPLQAMGMKAPFSHAANFSGMAAEPLLLSAVMHKSFVEVNEEGTEAAAVTVARMKSQSLQPQVRPFEMVVDRPFLFVIADKQTNAIFFAGIIADPLAK